MWGQLSFKAALSFSGDTRGAFRSPLDPSVRRLRRLLAEWPYVAVRRTSEPVKFSAHIKLIKLLISANRKLFIWLCEKNSVNSKTVIKTLSCERLENSRSNFFTVYNRYCNLSRFFGYQPILSGYMISSSPRTLPQFRSGMVHFLAISCVARYKAFRSAVSLGNTLLCLFRRR